MARKHQSRSARVRRDARRGGTAAIALLALLLCMVGPAAAQAPFNDSWFSPQDVPLNVLWQQDNTGATLQTGELTQCGSSGDSLVGHTVWYRVPGTGGPITVATNSAVDTILGVYRDADPSNAANSIVCNDDFGGTTASALTFNSVAGARYLVQIGGCVSTACANAGRQSEGVIQHVNLANDVRAFPEAITAGASLPRTNYASGTETGESLSCQGQSYSATVWFRYTAPAVGTVVVSSSSFTSAAAIYQGTSPSPAGCAVGNSSSNAAGPRFSIPVGPGDYAIQVGSLSGAGYGTFNVQVEFTENRDVDGDGDQKGSDCDDGNPNIRHGAADVPGNGIDEDCSGADSPPDTDGDGVIDPADRCPTQSAARRDANRDGCLDPTAFAAEPSLLFFEESNGITVRSLRVAAPKGAKVIVSCTRGCKKATKTSTRGRSKLVVFAGLKRKRLRNGTRVKIWITLPNRIGVYYEYRITKNAPKRSTARCLPPGSLTPRTSCA